MGQSIEEFNPTFQAAIRALMSHCQVTVGSGFRSEEEQARLYARWQARVPGQARAAAPGTSNHENPATGAVDLEGDLDCAHANAARFGLHFPMDDEPWHIELIDPGAENQMQYPGADPVQARMADVEQILFGGDTINGSMVVDADAAEVAAEYQAGKPEEQVPWDDLPEGVSAAQWAQEAGRVDPQQIEGLAGAKGGAGVQDAFSGGQTVGQAVSGGTGPGNAQGNGAALSPVQVASYYARAGFTGEALVTMVAIAQGESGFRADAQGDTSITGGGWGNSIGLSQIRSRTSEAGTGSPRDPTRLTDPAFNAQAAYQISSGGTNFQPWTVFTKGIYQQNLATARQAVAQLGNYTEPYDPQMAAQQPVAQQARLDTSGSSIGGLTNRRIPLADFGRRKNRRA